MRKELVFLVLVACSKDAVPTPVVKEQAKEEVVDSAVVASASPSTPLPSPPPQAGAVATGPTPRSAPAAVSSTPARAPAPPTLQPASAKITGSHFTLDVASPGCVAGSECTVTVRLDANGGFHINKDYPYKLTLNAAPNVEFLGRDPAGSSTFSKSAGDFVIGAELVATMTVRLKPSAKGTANLSGVYKMSVCSESNCQLEQTKIALDVPVQ